MICLIARLKALATFLVILVFLAATAYPQEKSSGPDPELTAIMEAENDKRLADADKLLAAALQDAALNSPESRRMSLLLNHLASLRFQQGRTSEAIAAAKQQIAVDEEISGPGSARVAADFSNLAMMCREAGENDAAEQAFRRGLAIARLNPARQNALPMILNNLAAFYMQQDRGVDAQPIIEEGLEICDQEQPGPVSCAHFRGLLASNLRRQGHENAAEGIIADSIAAQNDSTSAWYAMVTDLETLARQYEEDNSYDLAEAAYRQAIDIIERRSKPDEHFRPIAQLNALGEVLRKEGRSPEAETFFKRALEMQEQAASPERPQFARSLAYFGIMNLYRDEGRLEEMEPILISWLALQERILGATDVSLADTLLGLASVREELQEYSGVEALYERAFSIQQLSFGPDDPHLALTLEAYARILRQEGKLDKAQEIEAHLKALRQ
jgi:tetratricopeptide (TPR) repeat protein